MRHYPVVTLFSLLIVLGAATPLRAQEPATVDVAGGYAFSHIIDNEGTSLPAGWFASVGGYLTPHVAIVGEGTGAYKSESLTFSNAGLTFSADVKLRLYTFQAGPRFASRSGSTTVFGQVLAGGATISASGSATGLGFNRSSDTSKTYFAFTPGGGVDVRATEHLGVRFLANFQLISAEDDWGKVFVAGVGLMWANK